MEWWEDPFSRKIRLREFKRLWYLWLIDVFIFIVVVSSIYFLIISIDSKTPLNITVSSIILPASLSILINTITNHVKKWNDNSEWGEREVVVYRDIIETFTKILVAFHRDYGNPLEPQTLRGFYDLNMLSNSIQILRVLINEQQVPQFENYNLLNISELVDKLSIQYTSILSNNCTHSAVNLYYMIIMTHLIKLDEAVKQIENPRLIGLGRCDISIDLNYYLESLPFLYRIVYPIVEKGMKLETMTHDINYYRSKMFENITGANVEEQTNAVKNALDRAWDTRNFEINLYWKRAAYFWAFNTTIAIAYYHVITNEVIQTTWFSIILFLLGFTCSIAWFLSNIASKHWQENWENHIKLLEDTIYGRLYKTTVCDYKYPIKPSVSRLNLKISLFVILAWIAIGASLALSIYENYPVGVWIMCGCAILILVILCWSEIRRPKELYNIKQLLFDNKLYDELYIHSGTIEDVKISDYNFKSKE